MKKIVIDGIEYALVPISGSETSESGSSEVTEDSSPLDGYKIEDEGIRVAEPKVSDYRERFKKHQVGLSEVTAKPRTLPTLPKLDRELEQFGDLMFGEGLVQEM